LQRGKCSRKEMVLCEVERRKLREGGQIHEMREAQWRSKLWRRTDDGAQWRRRSSGGGQTMEATVEEETVEEDRLG